MNRRTALPLIVIVIIANAAAIWLYSGAGPAGPSAIGGIRGWNPVLRSIAGLLTLPIHTAGIADVRDVVLPVGLGLALLAIVAGFFLRSPDSAKLTAAANGLPQDPQPMRNPAERWLWATSAAVVVIAILSAVVNQRLDLAWGWIFRFAVGAGWAILIVRMFSVGMVKQAITGLAIVALITLALTIAHRADRHLAYFHWPIGPITPTAAFAALWAAMAFALVAIHIRYRRVGIKTVIFAISCVVAVYVLQQTGRRGPALALAAAVFVAMLLLLRARFRGPVMAAVLLLGVGIAAAGTGWFVRSQLNSADHEASGALALRFELWKLAGGMVAEHPSLGVGPDTFFIDMTNAVAPLRAVSPHVYHGNINLYAHNEWIQSAVELGIPGALLYLALPLGIIFMAWRRFHTSDEMPVAPVADGTPQAAAQNGEARDALIVLIAGLIAILVTESSGITLRTPMMPVWYWTLIGLLAALCGSRASQPLLSKVHVPMPIKAIVATALAAICFVVSYGDMSRALVQADPFKGLSLADRPRLYADKTVMARQQSAVYLSALAQAKPDEKRWSETVERWRRLFELIPAFRDTPARYAQALLAVGRDKDARNVLKKAIAADSDCYEPAANTLFARFRKDDPAGQLRCVQRALRNSALGGPLKAILTKIKDAEFVRHTFREELPLARSMVRTKKPPGRTTMVIELLRANAFLKFTEGEREEAISDQRLAAEYYAFLEESNCPYRRGHDAEVDAFFTLAKMLYQADHANYEEAFEAIEKAERYAVLSIKHDYVAKPDPEQGFIGGVVIPTEFPRRLFPLWRLSALLHVETGHEKLLVARVMSFLPPNMRNSKGIPTALARLYRRAHEDLKDVPSEKRPDHYDELSSKAQRFLRAAKSKSKS